MQFTKMHGLGNDFIIVAGMKQVHENVNQLAVRMCDRNFGIGADGLVYILPSAAADFQMRIFNSDGSEPEQCGNAIRCVGKYVYDHRLTDQTTIRVETKAGIQTLELTVTDKRVQSVRVDMGVPILQGLQIPTAIDQDVVLQVPISADGFQSTFTAVSMGNPHCVIMMDRLADLPFDQVGPALEVHPYFPKKTNVEFVEVHAPKEVTMRVWERGAGETLACGTGACAVCVAGVLAGRTERRVLVHLKGGDLEIEWSQTDNHVYMTGPAVEVFQGQWLLSCLNTGKMA
ncbi:diaminopimelate epimerase [Fodinisporobacter ferrooxydans]|uniref:Diaminopimelate epimerase n=1 Tax=Fodinisporobacter ferrooxydans TaxID=2901836 RepID=A0ABY4CF86_9BACL|nr:diaminopimelate epimerase [Alicyclobacillaceae bacterium MYW30-H2]